jgi:site-specific DNA-methyltransferase (adenine-specific)
VLKSYPDNTFHSVVTDPPYGIGNKIPTPENIIAYLRGDAAMDTGGDFLGHDWSIPSVSLWKEVYRVLKPGGFVACWASTRTWDIMSLGLRAAGFECRDTFAQQMGPSMLAHIHSQGFPKSVDISKQVRVKIEEQLRSQGVEGPIQWK